MTKLSSSNGKKANVPKLRFPGVTNDWKATLFSDIFDFLPNNTLSRVELSNNGIIRNIHYGDVLIKFGNVLSIKSDDIPFIKNADTLNNNLFLKNGDIVIADTAEDRSVGKVTEVCDIDTEKVVSGLHTIPCRTKKNFAPKFLGYYMNSPAYHNQLFPLMQGIKVLSISKSNIVDTIICYPDILEQIKIANLLSLIDKKISVQCQIVKALKKYKRGALSVLFPKKGEITPQYRFAGFTESWEQRKLKDFGQATGGTSIESEFSEDGIYKVISIGSYSENSVYTDQGIRAIESEKTKKRILNKGDLTMILNDKTSSGNIIGRVLNIEKSGVYVYNQRTERIEVDSSNYDSTFLYQMLNAPLIRDKIIKQSQGNTQIYVNWSVIEMTDYLVPKPEEQKKIGAYFSYLDHLITLHQRKFDTLFSLKNALLQQMFI